MTTQTGFIRKAFNVFTISALLVSGFFVINFTQAAGPWTVDPLCTDTTPVDGTCDDPNTFKTIQEAVNAASPGDTINVMAGIYSEQVVINKSLTLDGAGDSTVIMPSSAAVLTSVYTTGTQGGGAFFDGIAIGSIIEVSGVGVADVTIRDLKVDGELVTTLPAGAGHVSGIVFGETGGLIENVTVEDTRNVTPGSVRTYSIWLDAVGSTAVSVEVTNSTARFYGRNGINARGNNMTVDFNNNTVEGPGAVGPAQVPNGILLISGAGGVIQNNTISANHYTGVSFLGSGLLLFQARSGISVLDNVIFDVDDAVLIAGTSSATVSNNNLHDNVKGVQIEQAGATNNTITNNTVQDNTYGIFLATSAGAGNAANNNSITGSTTLAVNNESTNSFTVENNWWGASNPNFGTLIVGLVDFTPWCINLSCTNVDLGTPNGSNQITLTGNVNTQNVVGGYDVELTILDGTTITGNSSWDGSITLPHSEPSSGDLPAHYIFGAVILELGSSSGPLTFSQPLTIHIHGVTGQMAYKNPGETDWVLITNTCTEPFGSPTFVANECSISNSTDTKIMTNHLTSFASVVLQGPSVGGGGGGGGGGGSPTPTPNPTPTPTPTPTPNPTPAPVPPPGQVLGAITFANGTLVKTSESPTVYLVINGKLRPFTGRAIFVARGHKFSNIQIISSDLVTAENLGKVMGYPDGTLVRGTGKTVFVVSGDGETKLGITSMAEFNRLRFSLKKIVRLSDTELVSYMDAGIAQ